MDEGRSSNSRSEDKKYNNKALHPRDYIDRLQVSRGEGGRELTSIENTVDASIRGPEVYIKKAKKKKKKKDKLQQPETTQVT